MTLGPWSGHKMLVDLRDGTFGLRNQRSGRRSCLYNTCFLWNCGQIPASLSLIPICKMG